MPIIGHGIDLVETARIGRAVEQHGKHFLDRVFTHNEQAYCERGKKRYFEHLAGRFAAKEAILKVLGTGWSQGIAWTDMEILPAPSGQPVAKLSGQCDTIAVRMGITKLLLSISHTKSHAMASAIGFSED